jgi:tetratricopeptide (TPR) repeat protein
MALVAIAALLLYKSSTNKVAVILSAAFLEFALARLSLNILNRATNDFLGGLVFDMLFSEGAFAEKIRPHPKLPNLQLLLHWRDNGEAKKAFKTARRALYHRSEALPIWLFAAETAAVHLKNLPGAITIIHRLCRSKAFNSDQKVIAANRLRGLAMTRGFELAVEELIQSGKQRPVPKPLHKVEQLRSAGHFQEAELLLKEMIRKNPENFAAHAMLVRIYAQDFHSLEKAESAIRHLEAEPYADPIIIEFLRTSVKDWHAQPDASTALPSLKKPQRTNKLVLSAPRITQIQPIAPVPTSYTATEDLPRQKKPMYITGLSPDIADLVTESRFGTAVEILEDRIRKNPEDLDLRLELMHVQTNCCGYFSSGERVLKTILASRNFSEIAKDKASKHFDTLRQKYRELHPTIT